jgi:hypothetical protein
MYTYVVVMWICELMHRFIDRVRVGVEQNCHSMVNNVLVGIYACQSSVLNRYYAFPDIS